MSSEEKEGYISLKEYKGYVYVLGLEKGKYYVGYTERKDYERLDEHFGNERAQYAGAKWTKKFKPVEVLSFKPGSLEDENRVTIELMKKYGWWNVRGGDWCEVNMTEPPTELANKGFWNKMSNFCKSLWNFGEHILEEDEDRCFRCGRKGHWARECYAKRDIDGKYLG